MRSKGFLISFEGSEGCGKSTQIRLLAAHLRASGKKVVTVREPGGTDSGEVIRHLLQHAPEGALLTAEAELLLFAASRAQLVREVIIPALAEGKVVISDRYFDSTTVYQGVARKIPPEITGAINSFAIGPCVPNATFLLDLDREEALLRMKTRSRDRIERESESFFEAVRAGYLELAKKNRTRIHVLNAALPAKQIATEVQGILAGLGLFDQAGAR